jgi:CheY-like chemotaxis protein
MEPRNPSTEAARKNVLVVDSDAQSLRIVDISLRRAGFDVAHATDGLAAASLIERNPPPDLIISDLDLPGLDGLELCRRAKAPQRKIPFIFLARPSTDNKVRAFELGADDFLSKPVFVKEVLARVGALLQRHERERLSSAEAPGDRVTGSLSDLGTIDLLQTIATNGKSGVLHLHSTSGGTGEIYFRKGAVVDAEVGRLSGSDAVYRLLSWTEGRFEIEWRNIRRRDTVALAAPALLMEGMRRLDEWTRLTQQLPPLDTVFEVDYRLLAERLADIPDEVNGILRLFDGVRTAIQVIDDCGLSDLDALTVIGKLNSEELIRNVEAKVIEPEGAGPDLEGWLSDSSAAVPAAAPRPAEGDARLRRASDQPAAPPSSRPERSERPEREAREAREDRPSLSAPSERRDRISEHRAASASSPEEPAVVIPFPTSSPSTRTTMVSSSGGPAAAVAGEISNGVTTASSVTAPSPSPPPPHLPSEPAHGSVSIPRSTDPGLGPLAPVTVVASPTAPIAPSLPPAVAPPPVAAPASPPPAVAAPPAVAPAAARTEARHTPHAPAAAHPRRDSAPHVPDLPFSDSATRWMSEGDEIHTSRNTKAEAIEELGLPSRNRGLVYVAAVAVAAVAVIVGVRHFRVEKTEPVAVVSQGPAAAPAAPPAAEPSPAPPAAQAPNQPGEKLADNTAPNPPVEKITTPEAAAAAAPGAAAAAPAPAGAPGEPAAVSPEFAQLLSACQSTFNSGRMRDATTACTAAVEANPDSPKAVALLAHAEFNRSHRKEALSWAEKAIKLDPKTADAYVIIGGVQQDAGRNADAKAAYRKYLELAPKGQYAADLRAIVDSL